ncbi:polysaccharide deacetylase [Flavobacterium noncentrifugens]|uniref:Peptidoglycan/xylan/chitin deacetylase, PgdA/CDA1 family n=2 Tax=Flavobacterium noncentrifugens TaxID=1128970 RepID=A0A1G8VEI1_9FLAO|nr:polysaccharide deacetylase [Flavobacterium noncentrifugens]SDJ64506.1 Peptidoglycan/xylan/chitin deacetylase, PgdA/CDA1 family [Flavobacterium noncentrifugens]
MKNNPASLQINMTKRLYYKALKLKNRLIQGKPVLVFMYHRIDNDVSEELGLQVTLDNFEQQLIYIKKNYTVLRLDDQWAIDKKAGAVLTFDDGYADNFLHALPLLEKYNIPAAFFITTAHIGTSKEFWWDHLASDYANCGGHFYLPGMEEKVSKADYSYKNLADLILNFKNPEKEKWLETFENLNQIAFKAREGYRSMSVSELQALAKHPLASIGLHTHHHYPLGTLSEENQKKELLMSVQKLQQLTGKPADYLALPHGSYNESTEKLAKEIGLKGILLANNGYSNNANRLSGKMNRIFMPDFTGKRLEKFLAGFEFNFGSLKDL